MLLSSGEDETGDGREVVVGDGEGEGEGEAEGDAEAGVE